MIVKLVDKKLILALLILKIIGYIHSFEVSLPTTVFTGVIAALVARPIGLVTMLAQVLVKKAPTKSITTNKTSFLIVLTSSNQLAFPNKFLSSLNLIHILIT